MDRFYRFAGVEFQITMPKEIFYSEERHLEPFAVTSVRKPHVFRFEMVDSLPEPEGTCLVKAPSFSVYEQNRVNVRYFGGDRPQIRVVNDGLEHYVQVEKNQYRQSVGTKVVLECISMEHLIAQENGFILHCSFIDWNGKAILFTAPSETGKSTQAELWSKFRGAEIINGDRAAVRMIDGNAYAAGIPFSGSSVYCKNRTLPLAAVVYLQQAPVTSIRRLRGAQAFCRIWEGCSVNTWDKEDVQRVSALVEQVVQQVPVYLLACTPDESAVLALEQALKV